MSYLFRHLQNRVSFLKDAIKMEKIHKGYSSDDKYIVYFKDNKYLLRINHLYEFDRKELEFRMLKEIRKYNVNCSEPIDIGVLNELKLCYTIYSYLDGTDVKASLNKLTKKEQYIIGMDAGNQLAHMHLLNAPSTIKPNDSE